MSRSDVGKLFTLLPAFVRAEDKEGFLEALTGVLDGPLATLHADIERLYDDAFIETCGDDIVPYIGDLVGAELLDATAAGFSQRARVANTLSYRRRKGTIAMLEQLARDVTGWSARAVEYFQLLATSQHLDHVRMAAPATADLRDAGLAELSGGPFEATTHTAEMRLSTTRRGRYNLPNVGIHLWRCQAVPVAAGRPREVRAGGTRHTCFTFDPLGRDQPLFLHPETEPSVTHRAELWNVPVPIDRRVMLVAPGRWYPSSASVNVGGTRVRVNDLVVADLSAWPRALPAGAVVAIDPILGRLQLATANPEVRVAFHAGSWGDIGAGAWDRRAAWTDADRALPTWQGAVSTSHAGAFTDMGAALAAWSASGADHGLIVVLDDDTYVTPPLQLGPARRLWIVAGEWPRTAGGVRENGGWTPGGARPHLRGDLVVAGAQPAELLLEGLLLEGNVQVQSEGLGALRLRNCQLVTVGGRRAAPGSIRIGRRATRDTPATEVEITRCLLGAVGIDGTSASLSLTDSVLDGGDGTAIGGLRSNEPGPPATVSACTVFGPVRVQELALAENTIFVDRVVVESRQEGCVRFCWLPAASRTPRQYACVFDGEGVAGPQWLSRSSGVLGYGRLARSTDDTIRRGASDEGELGAFHFLADPQREANLHASLPEYLRFGLEAGVFFEDESTTGTRQTPAWPGRPK